MKKNKYVVIITILSLVLLGIIGIIMIFDNSQVKVKAYNAVVDIDSYGNMEVTETWIIKYPSGYSVRFRDIPYGKNHRNNPLVMSLDYSKDVTLFEKESVKVEIYDVDNDKVLEEGKDYTVGYSFRDDYDELNEPIECYPYDSTCESIFVNLGNGGMKGTKAFTYTYKINGAVTSYDDFSELNWVFFKYAEERFVLTKMEKMSFVKKATVEIHLPANSYTKEDILSWGHGTRLGDIKIIDNQNIQISCQRVIGNDFFEVRVAFPSDIVSNISRDHKITGLKLSDVIKYETKYANDVNSEMFLGNVINVITILLIPLTILIVIYTYFKFDKEYKAVFDKEYLREPPNEKNPADVGYLMNFGSVKDESVTATILDLINRKILVLSDKGYEITSKDPDFDISLNDNININSLLPHEREVIEFFINTIGNGKSVNTQAISKFGKKESEANKLMTMSNRYISDVKKEYSNNNYFENARQKAMSKNGIFIAIYVLAAISFFIISTIKNIECNINYLIIGALFVIYFIYLSTIKKRSRYGNEEYAKWKAFKKFLEDFSHFEDYPMPGIIVWEHYLVYATVFGISDKVMEQLRIKLKELDMDDNATFMRGYYYHRTNNFFIYNTLSHSYTQAKVRSISTIAAAKSRSASGGGHGGGFSGGSSFGGGGGGGRSR